MDAFWENRKKTPKWQFLVIFGLILARFLRSQYYDFDAIAHTGAFGCRITEENYKYRMDSFWEIWNFHWKVGRKKVRKHKNSKIFSDF